jgi:hypothetical protein
VELKLSACGGKGRTPGGGLEGVAGSAGMGRSLTPSRYAASIITVQSISENKVFNLPMRQLPYLHW